MIKTVRSSLRLVITFSVFIGLSITFQATSQIQSEHLANIAKTIRKTAKELVYSNSLIIKPPIFEYDPSSKALQYYLGNVNVELLGLASNDVYELPFEMQIRVEALRK